VRDLAVGELEPERLIVVPDHVGHRREAAVVVEAPLLVRPQTGQRGGAVAMVGVARGLEVVAADLGGRGRIPARLGRHRRDVAARGFPVKGWLPRAAALASKLPAGGRGAGIASW